MKKFVRNFFGFSWLILLAAEGTTIGAFDRQQAAVSTASISGVVIDSVSNLPIAGARVRLGQTTPVVTDQSGSFGFSEIVPGVYSVIASAEGYLSRYLGSPEPDLSWSIELKAGERRDAQFLSLAKYPHVFGRVMDSDGKPLVGIRVIALTQQEHRSGLPLNIIGALSITSVTGTYDLDVRERSARLFAFEEPPPRSSPSPTPSRTSYRPAFWPSVLEYENARPIDLVPGASLRNVDIVMQKGSVHSATISVPGLPAGTSVVLQPSWCLAGCPIRQATTDQTFKATIRDLPPDRYSISFLLSGTSVEPSQRHIQGGIPEVIVGDDDVTSVVDLRGSTVTATVASLSGSLPTGGKGCLRSFFQLYCANINSDGSLRFEDVRDDEYNLSVVVPDKQVGAIRAGAVDVTDRSIRIAKPISFEVTLTNGLATLRGSVSGSRDLLLQARVVAFPVDQSLWTGFGLEPRRIQMARPVQDRYALTLPPGDYWVAVVTGGRDGVWQYPDRLRSWLPRATRVLIGDGASVNVDLKVAADR